MHFAVILPRHAELKPYIHRYVFVRAEGSTDTMSPPAGDPRFINGKHVQPLLPNYGGMIFVKDAVADFNGVLSDGLVLFGANQTTIGITTVSGWFSGMMVDFEPGGMHALLGIDLRRLQNKVLRAADCSDRSLLACDNLFKTYTSAEEIAGMLDAYFIGRLPRTEDDNYSRMRRVVAACDDAKCNIRAAQMAAVACVGERQFLRIFRQYMGISPKQFIRLRRFHKTLQDMMTAPAPDLLAIAIRHGYYDLSHMALEFRDMGCCTPSHFRMLGIPLTDDFSIFFA